jgi:hypothetical protein
VVLLAGTVWPYEEQIRLSSATDGWADPMFDNGRIQVGARVFREPQQFTNKL